MPRYNYRVGDRVVLTGYSDTHTHYGIIGNVYTIVEDTGYFDGNMREQPKLNYKEV